MRLILHDVSMRATASQALFENVSIEVPAGASLAVLGPSGSGKSTLLAGVAGLLRPSRGSIRLVEAPPNAHTEWIFQSTPLLNRRTALDNVKLSALVRGRAEDAVRRESIRALQRLGLAERIAARAHRLSGGERQRVAVARTLVARPDLILADEPTASLDAQSRDLVSESLHVAAQSGSIILIATHDSAVAATCSHVLDLTLHRPT